MTRQEITETVRRVVLANTTTNEVSNTQPLNEVGVDSLDVIDIELELQDIFNINSIYIESAAKTVEGVVDCICDKLEVEK